MSSCICAPIVVPGAGRVRGAGGDSVAPISRTNAGPRFRWIATSPVVRPSSSRIYEAIVRRLGRVGPIDVEGVGVGVMIKPSRTFAEVRARPDRLVLGLLLWRKVEHPKITKFLKISTNRGAHFIDLYRVADIDRDVRDWVTEAYLSSPR